MSEEPVKPQRSALQVALRRLTIATVAIYLALALVFIVGYVDAANRRAELTKVTLNTNNALCALRSDLEQRVEGSIQFLKDNPDGVPGISAKVIQQSIDNQTQTINALSQLHCVT